MLLEGKVAVVTGGAQGIGREIAILFAREGAAVAVCDSDGEKAARTAAEIEALGRKSLAVEVDVTDFKKAQETANKIIDSLGRIDILVNNAGITRDGLFMRMSEAAWDSVVAVNLKGAFNFAKAVIRPMLKNHAGRIISISSVVGINGNAGQANYSASKAGIIGLTKSLAKECAARGVTVNAIAPGFIKTRMTDAIPEDAYRKWIESIPMKRIGEPADVAKAALFLAGELADYITGQVIVVDGGMTM